MHGIWPIANRLDRPLSVIQEWANIHCMKRCALCLKDKKLCRSHIIPEFMYSSLYDEKNHFHALSAVEGRNCWTAQQGVWEWLLCSDCETQFSKYETYVSSLMSGTSALDVKKDGRLIALEGIDYTRFKLFQLSILWRAGISTMEFFSNIKLGPHGESLRLMLLSENPGEPQEYPVLLFPILHEDEPLTDLIVQPSAIRLESGHNGYRFTFGGILWAFIVSKHKMPDMLLECILNKSGRMILMEKPISEIGFITEFGKKLDAQNKWPA